MQQLLIEKSRPIPGSTTELQLLVLNQPLIPSADPNILLRKQARAFWQTVFRTMQDGHNVVGIGSAGTGKTSTTPYALKLLLETGRPVVYLIRGEKSGAGMYYEFRQASSGGYKARAYPEASVREGTIPALSDKDAFLFIEPCLVKELPPRWIRSPWALIVSLDRRHYQGAEKSGPGECKALFFTFPLWTLTEMKEARPFIVDKTGVPILASDDEVEEAYRVFGPIVRTAFSQGQDRNQYLEEQDAAVRRLQSNCAIAIITQGVAGIDASDPNAPSSSIVAYDSKPPFTSTTTVFVSQRVRDEVWKRHLGALWTQLSEASSPEARYQFEKYCRGMLASPGMEFDIRSVSKSKRAGTFQRDASVWCIKQVDDPFSDVQANDPGTLFFSTNERQEFVDALIKLPDGTYIGFNFACGQTHSCTEDGRTKYAALAKSGRPFQLYYVVPSWRYANFLTTPRAFNTDGVQVYVLCMTPPEYKA